MFKFTVLLFVYYLYNMFFLFLLFLPFCMFFGGRELLECFMTVLYLHYWIVIYASFLVLMVALDLIRSIPNFHFNYYHTLSKYCNTIKNVLSFYLLSFVLFLSYNLLLDIRKFKIHCYSFLIVDYIS